MTRDSVLCQRYLFCIQEVSEDRNVSTRSVHSLKDRNHKVFFLDLCPDRFHARQAATSFLLVAGKIWMLSAEFMLASPARRFVDSTASMRNVKSLGLIFWMFQVARGFGQDEEKLEPCKPLLWQWLCGSDQFQFYAILCSGEGKVWHSFQYIKNHILSRHLPLNLKGRVRVLQSNHLKSKPAQCSNPSRSFVFLLAEIQRIYSKGKSRLSIVATPLAVS